MKRVLIPDRRRGFTLIEMLVVLMIMGLCVGLVGSIVRPDDRMDVRWIGLSVLALR